MGNILCRGEKDEAWKQQNKEMVENPAYKFANIAKGGTLIDAYRNEGPEKVLEIAENEISSFLYSKDGKRHYITESEFLRWKWKFSKRVAGLDDTEHICEEKLKEEHAQDNSIKFSPHEACWDLEKRGGVGETPFHLLCLMDSPVHFEVAKILLNLYPNLALDVYEGEEYYGESALHIAIVIGDFELVQLLVEAGANVNQRATGRFFLPEDQKKVFTGRTDYEGYAYYGEYPLAFATCLGKMDIYDYLLDHGANPNLQDVFGNSILHMVVISDQTEMYRYAVRHHKLQASTSIKNNDNLTPLSLACKLGRYAIFKEMLELDSIEFWSFSTTFCSAHPLHTLDSVAPDGSINWNSALMIIVNGEKDDHLDMLDGGVMRQLLIEKWKTFAKKRFMVHLVFAVAHVLLFSVCIYTRPMGCLLLYRGTVDAIRYTSESIVVLNCLAKVVYEVKEIYTAGIFSFVGHCKHAPAQAVFFVSCLLVLACIPLRFTRLHTVEDILIILAAPCAWSYMLFFARGYKLTGPFVTMIYKMIVGDLLRFGIIYIIFISGFSQAFFFLFRYVTSDVNDDDLDKFETFPETVIKLYQMTFGEFKYSVFDLAHYAPLAKITFAFFMILVPILLLNMLIAMMGNTHTKIISKSTKEWWKQWAKIVLVMERGISRKDLIEYQKAYSVRLSSAPPPSDGCPASQEQRALVVIRVGSKSRARKRKEAVYRWKALCGEIIQQWRQKQFQGQPFHLRESLKKGRLLNDDKRALLTRTVSQLAWEKDIDLTKGHSFVTDKDSICSQSPSRQPVVKFLSNNSTDANSTKVIKQVHDSDNNEDEVVLTSRRKKRTHLLYNRVSPLSISITGKEDIFFSDSSNNLISEDSESNLSDLVFQNSFVISSGPQVKGDSISPSHQGYSMLNRISSEEQQDITFPSTEAHSVNNKTDSCFDTVRSKQQTDQTQEWPESGHNSPEISTSLWVSENLTVTNSNILTVENIKSTFTILPKITPATRYWIEDSLINKSAKRWTQNKDMMLKFKKIKKGKIGAGKSTFSNARLTDSAASSNDSQV